MHNPVVKKIVYIVMVELISPLCVSEGEGELTDADVLRDRDGTPFVSGASLAGAMRAYIEKQQNESCIFGYSDPVNDKGKMSVLFVSDLYFWNGVKTTVRDSVALSSDKTAVTEAKFDMEVIDSGAKGFFILELTIRKNDSEEEYLQELQDAFSGISLKEIRLGRKKTRGYGEFAITALYKKEFTQENILEYADAYPMDKLMEGKPEKLLDMKFENVSKDSDPEFKKGKSKYISLTLPLKLSGGISIRQYSARKGEPDYVHITANGKPVIPGTSFAGAIRHRIMEMMQELGVSAEKRNDILRAMFGYVEKDGARNSKIIVSECILEGAKALIMVRNGISRFESGTKDGALYKEVSYVGGTTTLQILIKRQENGEEYAQAGLLLLAMKDIQNGFLCVGGQTAVGRGLFEADGEILMDGKPIDENVLLAQAASVLQEV